ncbi:hypothetical protein LSA2308_00175 [Staphylococcus phage LSA2308]|nr:hypothetical protein LSA2308_00175 [Staphylococcus phage LSA2308]USZ62837.1 hypothetical protein LSA2311_orf00029 [Staphylococcus phage LSA2311]
MANLVPHFYNTETNEWEELYTKPIAREVFNIMKEDYLAHKGEIGYYIAKYKDGDTSIEQPNVVVFYDVNDYETMTLNKEEMTRLLNDYIDNNLQGKFKPFSLTKFLQNLEDLNYALPKQEKFHVDTIQSDKRKFSFPDTNAINTNPDILDALTATDNHVYMEVKYLYNGHPIDDKKLIKGNQDLKN